MPDEFRPSVLQGVGGDAVNGVSAILKSGSAKIKSGSAKNEIGTDTALAHVRTRSSGCPFM